METKLQVSVTDPSKIGEIARKLRRAGMSIEEEDAGFRLITGSVKFSDLDSLRKIPGVRHVEPQRTIDGPESDALVQ
jgi:hypothetical protein